MRIEIGGFDHHRLRNRGFGNQTIRDPRKDAVVTPPFITVEEGLRRAILPKRITPAQTIAIETNYATNPLPVIDAWLARLIGKRLKPSLLHVRQPEKIARWSISFRRLKHCTKE